MRRYRQQPRFRLRSFFNKYTLRYWAIGAACLLVILAGALIWRSIRTLRPEDTQMYLQEEIVVGIADSRFSSSEDGQPSGFDREVAEEIVHSVYPDAELTFLVVPAEEASYQLRIGEIDLAMGTLTYDVLKTQGLSVSDGYFTDSVHAYVAPDSPASVGSLADGRLLIMTSELLRQDVRNALNEKGVSPSTLLDCSSYPDAIAAVSAKTSDALLAPRYKMEEYEHGLTMVEEPICSISYRIAAWTSNSDAIDLFNLAIAEKRADGTIDTIAQKYGLMQYAPAGN